MQCGKNKLIINAYGVTPSRLKQQHWFNHSGMCCKRKCWKHQTGNLVIYLSISRHNRFWPKNKHMSAFRLAKTDFVSIAGYFFHRQILPRHNSLKINHVLAIQKQITFVTSGWKFCRIIKSHWDSAKSLYLVTVPYILDINGEE